MRFLTSLEITRQLVLYGARKWVWNEISHFVGNNTALYIKGGGKVAAVPQLSPRPLTMKECHFEWSSRNEKSQLQGISSRHLQQGTPTEFYQDTPPNSIPHLTITGGTGGVKSMKCHINPVGVACAEPKQKDHPT